MESEVMLGRLYLIPPKGMLEELKPVITRKLNGECKLLNGDFEIPSPKFNFEVEAIIDDGCSICPVAVEFIAEVVAKYSNVTAKIYNASYVDPPFEISATPAFRINGKVKFTGLPLDPQGMNRYFSEFMKEAYLLSHPKLQDLLESLRRFGEANGFKRNPNTSSFMNIVYRLLKNIDEHGYPYCPCRPLRKKPGMSLEEIYELNKDKICPCVYAKTEVKTRGCCLCSLYWSKEKVEEYVKQRIEKYGWIIKEIERVEKALEELKKRVIEGRGKMLAESIINKLNEIYAFFPD